MTPSTCTLRWRKNLATAVPQWPLGLPGWEDDVTALTLVADRETLLCIWSRGAAQSLTFPVLGNAHVAFPETAEPWGASSPNGDLLLHVPAGPDARVFLIEQ